MSKTLIKILFIFIISCRSSPENSFYNLKDAFIDWYFRYNPVESTRYASSDQHGSFKSFRLDDREEYSADLSRFLIELSQIDETKLDVNDRIDYRILYSQIEKMMYIMNNHREFDWNPYLVLKQIYYGLFLLSDGTFFDMDTKVESIKSRLIIIPEIIESSKENLIAYSEIHLEYSIEMIDQILKLLSYLPTKINSDNITLDKIDVFISESILILKNYKNWLNEEYKKLNKINFPYSLKLMDYGYEHFIGEKYSSSAVYDMAINKLVPTQNRLFNLCLPIYLTENDEPIWLDRDDTLEVISSVLEILNNKSENLVSHSNLLSYYYKSIVNIENFLIKNSIINHIESNSVQLEYSPDYSISYTQNFLSNHLYINSLNDKVYNIDIQNNNLIKNEIDILNAKYIFPGYVTQLNYSQKFGSLLSKIFPNKLMQEGWKQYAVKMLFNEGYGGWDDKYHILKLKEEVISIVRAITEYNYYNNQMSKNDILNYYMKMGFLNREKALRLIKRSELDYFSGTQSFIGLMELYSIRTEYKRKIGKGFNLNNFHTFVLKNGFISPSEIKKKLN